MQPLIRRVTQGTSGPNVAARLAAPFLFNTTRSFASTAMVQDPFKPAARVAGQRKDVWSIVNEAAQASSVQPMVNMGQGFFGISHLTVRMGHFV